MRRLTILLLLAALAGSLAACGDDSDSGGGSDSSSADVDSFAKALSGSSHGAVAEKDARCVGEQVLPDLSTAGKKAMLTKSSAGPDALSDADQEVLFAAFDECIKTVALAGAVAKEMGTGANALGDDTIACVVDKLTGDYPKSGQLMRALLADDSQKVLSATITACVSPTDLEAQLVEEFKNQGLNEEQAKCVASKMTAEISPEQLVELGQSGEDLPADVQKTITDATTACLTGG